MDELPNPFLPPTLAVIMGARFHLGRALASYLLRALQHLPELGSGP